MKGLSPEQFWQELLSVIAYRPVVPVLGAELLTVQNKNGQQVSLYYAVAERLLEEYGATGPLSGHGSHRISISYGSLYEAVRHLEAAGHPVEPLYNRIYWILNDLLTDQAIPEPLRQLAEITDFNLFVSTTPDDLLVRALNHQRYGNHSTTREIQFSPNKPADLPESYQMADPAVFYLFGKAAPVPFVFAIHDEDALEFCYKFQDAAQEMSIRLRQHDLLFIGCTFTSWLVRYFLRVSNPDRLTSNGRGKKEYLTGDSANSDVQFAFFLNSFNFASRLYECNAAEFVAELNSRWKRRNQSPGLQPPGTPAPLPPAGHFDFFINYCRDDEDAAKKIRDALVAMGGVTVWFDLDILRPGDNLDDTIRNGVENSVFFLALISRNTERLDKHFIFSERGRAGQLVSQRGVRFIFPIIVDEQGGPLDKYPIAFSEFKGILSGNAPGGVMDEILKKTLLEELRNWRRALPR
jgi:hypothetical protein